MRSGQRLPSSSVVEREEFALFFMSFDSLLVRKDLWFELSFVFVGT